MVTGRLLNQIKQKKIKKLLKNRLMDADRLLHHARLSVRVALGAHKKSIATSRSINEE